MSLQWFLWGALWLFHLSHQGYDWACHSSHYSSLCFRNHPLNFLLQLLWSLSDQIHYSRTQSSHWHQSYSPYLDLLLSPRTVRLSVASIDWVSFPDFWNSSVQWGDTAALLWAESLHSGCYESSCSECSWLKPINASNLHGKFSCSLWLFKDEWKYEVESCISLFKTKRKRVSRFDSHSLIYF